MEKNNFFIILLILIFSASIVFAGENNNCSTHDYDCDGKITLNDSKIINQYWRDGTPITMNIVTGTNCDNLTNYLAPFWQNGEQPITINDATLVSAQVARCIKDDSNVCPTVKPLTCESGEELVTEYDSNNCVRYYCKDMPVVCTEDVWTCPDGTTVGRNPNNNCEFYDCQTRNCESVYDPVCGEITTCPSCNTDSNNSNISCEGPCYIEEKTYNSICEMRKAGATYAYHGQCESEKLVKEKVSCIFNTTNREKCYDSTGKYSCTANVASTNGNSSCTIDVSGRKGTELNWKSSCGGYAQTVLDGINENVKFDCENTGAVTETVKCVLDNAKGGEECYSNKGKCIVNIYGGSETSTGLKTSTMPRARNRYGTCTVDVKGRLGETVTWKSDCGGYAYTVMDGDNEYAKFKCDNTKPPVVVEDNYGKAKWTCTNGLEFSKESNACQPYSYWKNLAIRTCNQYSTKCGTTINPTTSGDTNATTVTVVGGSGITSSTSVAVETDTNIIKCIGGEVTVDEFEVGDKCNSTCTSYTDPAGCIVTKCSNGEEKVNCSIQSCRKQPIKEIKEIKEKCKKKNGKVLAEVNEGNGCTNYVCVSEESSLVCNSKEDIPTEKVLECEEKGGEYIYHYNKNGCLSIAKCVGIKEEDKNINPQVINDSTKLLELVLKLESLKISLQETQLKIEAMANYYNTNDDSNSASNFENASKLLQTAIEKVGSLKEFIKERVDNFSEDDAKQVRVTIAEIKETILKKVLLEILG